MAWPSDDTRNLIAWIVGLPGATAIAAFGAATARKWWFRGSDARRDDLSYARDMTTQATKVIGDWVSATEARIQRTEERLEQCEAKHDECERRCDAQSDEIHDLKRRQASTEVDLAERNRIGQERQQQLNDLSAKLAQALRYVGMLTTLMRQHSIDVPPPPVDQS